jgi:hypothetical protein
MAVISTIILKAAIIYTWAFKNRSFYYLFLDKRLKRFFICALLLPHGFNRGFSNEMKTITVLTVY